MEQIQLQGGKGNGTGVSEGLEMEIVIPQIDDTIKKIEAVEAEVIEDDFTDEEEEATFMMAIMGAIFGSSRKKAAEAKNEEALKKEMEKIHPRLSKILRGCGCGM